ncbi:hypothetical protein [Allocoleopsis sp.]|uniref:hypothetical protein n=1 Tax=Allocoleopsis sp. TaxID=3088169 RepID=UPI002FCF5F38
MQNKNSWLTDRELQDISDQEASLIAGDQITAVTQLSDVSPSPGTWMTDPERRTILQGEIRQLAPQQGQR